MLTKYLNRAPTERGRGFTISLNKSEIKLQTYKPAPIKLLL